MATFSEEDTSSRAFSFQASSVALPVGVIWLLDRVGLFSYDGVLSVLLSWEFLAGTTAGATLFLWARSRK